MPTSTQLYREAFALLRPALIFKRRPSEVDYRVVPGRCGGDLVCGAFNRSAIAMLVERTTGCLMLVHLNGTHVGFVLNQTPSWPVSTLILSAIKRSSLALPRLLVSTERARCPSSTLLASPDSTWPPWPRRMSWRPCPRSGKPALEGCGWS